MTGDRFVVLSGCSGGGKSTLLEELARRGCAVVEEPGRRIVAEELRIGGRALPWVDPVAFARRAVALSLEDRNRADADVWTVFDRGLIDAAAALEHLTGEPALERLGRTNRYHRRVFLTPPWPEIYVADPERRHGFDEAVAEYGRLTAAYRILGYEATILPQVSTDERADLVLDALSAG
jgi:predicted ATPase